MIIIKLIVGKALTAMGGNGRYLAMTSLNKKYFWVKSPASEIGES